MFCPTGAAMPCPSSASSHIERAGQIEQLSSMPMRAFFTIASTRLSVQSWQGIIETCTNNTPLLWQAFAANPGA
jgi:hypothetical protein